MKKHVLLILTNLLLFTGVSFATDFHSLPGSSAMAFTSPVGVWVKLTIIFHRPKLQCLREFGLCFNINFGTEKEDPVIGEGGCPISMQLDKGQLQLRVTHSALKNYESGNTLQYFQEKSSITLEDDTELPESLSRELGASIPIVIKAGNYPVQFQDDAYIITFQFQ